MGSKKLPKQVKSTISASGNPAASSTTHTPNQSSILRSSFAPYRLGVPFFASVIQGFDGQHIRIHDTTSGRLCCEHAVNPGTEIHCLDWGYLGYGGTNERQSKPTKKRKRTSQTNGSSSTPNLVLAYGTNRSEVEIYSPTESKVITVLKDAHSSGVQNFKFANDGHDHRAYSVGGDGKMVQWDLKTQTATMTITLPNGPANALHPIGSKVVCALHSAYIIDPKTKSWSNPYNVSTNNVHTVLGSYRLPDGPMQFLTIAEADHFINVFDENSPLLRGSLRTENESIASDLWSLDSRSVEVPPKPTVPMLQTRQALAILNRDGVLEIFPEPLDFTVASSGERSESLKARMKQRSRKSTAQVRIVRPEPVAAQVSLINMSFQGSQIAVAWVEEGVKVIFDTIRWRDENTGGMLLKNSVDISKEKSGTGLGAASVNGVKDIGKSYVDDSRAVVGDALEAGDVSMDDAEPDVIDISSFEEQSESEDDEPAGNSTKLGQDTAYQPGDEEVKATVADNEDQIMSEAGAQVETEPPSFGDLVRANAPDPINVHETLPEENRQSIVPANSTSLQALPSGMSLGTVLTQSLRTNDNNLLESCLHTRDLATVRSTIERLESSFATKLLERLAERLHNRPGRAGSLMVWIQWTLVAHGGYLAGQPDIMRKLRSLHKVVRERAGSLQSLLNLKGKLDMLEAQMNLRRSMMERGLDANAEDDDDEEAVIYVEGQDDDDDDDDDSEGEGSSDDSEEPQTMGTTMARSNDLQDEGASDEDEGETDEPHRIPNGVPAGADDVSDSDEDEVADEEASESDIDSDEELDNEDVDHASADTESSDGENSPPPTRTQANGRLSNGV